MSMRFDGKAVIVTGGTSGIGLATALRFAAEGANVVVADHDAAKAAQAVEQLHAAGAAPALALACEERSRQDAVAAIGR